MARTWPRKKCKRVQGQFELTRDGFINTVNLINLLLHVCSKKKDPFIPRKVIILSTTFYTYVDPKQKVYLYNALFFHEIWKSRNIWDTIFFEQIFEELVKMNSLEQNYEEQLEMQRNTIYGLLGSVVHNMLLFDQQKPQVKEMLQKYSKLYSLSEENTKSLLAQVDKYQEQKLKIRIMKEGSSPKTPSTPKEEQQVEDTSFLQSFKPLIDLAAVFGLKK